MIDKVCLSVNCPYCGKEHLVSFSSVISGINHQLLTCRTGAVKIPKSGPKIKLKRDGCNEKFIVTAFIEVKTKAAVSKLPITDLQEISNSN